MVVSKAKSDSEAQWRLDLIQKPFKKDGPKGWYVTTWSATHSPTGNSVLLTFDEHGCMLAAECKAPCSRELFNEAVKIFSDYLRDADRVG